MVGAVGVLFAPWAEQADGSQSARFTVRLAILTAIASYAVFDLAGRGIWALTAGVILLDVGVQVRDMWRIRPASTP